MDEILLGYLADWTSAKITEACAKAGVVCGPINNIEQVANSEQIKARKMIANIHYPGDGPVLRAPANSIKMTGLEEVTEYMCYPLGYNTISELSKYADEATLHKIFDGVLAESAEAVEARITKGGIKK